MSVTGLRTAVGIYVPIVRWLPRYRRSWLGTDLLAGVVVASVAIPTALGYAGVADVPVQAGLYSLPLGLLAYAIFGSSRQLSVGPSSTVALMSGSTVVAIAGTDDPARAMALSSAMAIAAGLLLFLAGVLRTGWVTDFMSRPVIVGFSFGLGVLVVSSELPHILGLPKQSSEFVSRSLGTLRDLGAVNLWTVALGCCSIAVLLIGARKAPRVPWALTLMVLSIATAPLIDPGARGIEVIGAVPTGVPPLGLPLVGLEDLSTVLVGGLAIAIVAVGEGLSAGRIFAAQGGYRISADQEFVGIGAANAGAGFSGGIAVCGSLSRTATAVAAGARSQVSSLAAMAAVLVVLVSLAGLLAQMPRVILSAVVVVSVWFLLDVKALRHYAHVRRNDFVSSVTALFGVLLLGPLYGLLAAIGISLLGLVYRSSRVLIDPVGRIPDERAGWGALKGHPERVGIPGLMVLRLASPVFWASAPTTHDKVLELVDDDPTVRGVVLDIEATGQLDTTAADMLQRLCEDLADADIEVYFAHVLFPTRRVLRRTGLYDELGEQRFTHSITAAVQQACLDLGLPDVVPAAWSDPELQRPQMVLSDDPGLRQEGGDGLSPPPSPPDPESPRH